MLGNIGFVVVLIIICLFVLVHSKIEFIKHRTNSKKLIAEVIEYRSERSSMRNDFTSLYYPYVRVILESGEKQFSKLKYANSRTKPFEIGENISVFWYGGDLLYWHAYDNGLFKYLPSRWNLFKNRSSKDKEKTLNDH